MHPQVAAAAPRDGLRPHPALAELALRAVAGLAAGASAGAFRGALAALPPEAKLRLQARPPQAAQPLTTRVTRGCVGAQWLCYVVSMPRSGAL